MTIESKTTSRAAHFFQRACEHVFVMQRFPTGICGREQASLRVVNKTLRKITCVRYAARDDVIASVNAVVTKTCGAQQIPGCVEFLYFIKLAWQYVVCAVTCVVRFGFVFFQNAGGRIMTGLRDTAGAVVSKRGIITDVRQITCLSPNFCPLIFEGGTNF